MSRARRSGVVVACLVLASLAACGEDTDSGDDKGFAEQSSASASASVSADPLGDGMVELATDVACPVEGDLEGQFTVPSDMLDYLQCILPGAAQWVDTIYVDTPMPVLLYVPAGVSNPADCAPDETDLMFCPTDNVVYLGESAIWRQYSVYGDAAPAVVLAHELTHYFQHRVGGDGTSKRDGIRYENQADCGAGAFMKLAQEQGWMNRDDDILDLSGSLSAASEAEGPDRTHGTLQERLESFDVGFLSVLDSPLYDCVRFVPEHPIIT
jgi:uncharacterized protein